MSSSFSFGKKAPADESVVQLPKIRELVHLVCSGDVAALSILLCHT
jgi:hypothetical protein